MTITTHTNICLSTRSKTQKNTYYMILLYEIEDVGKLINVIKISCYGGEQLAGKGQK